MFREKQQDCIVNVTGNGWMPFPVSHRIVSGKKRIRPEGGRKAASEMTGAAFIFSHEAEDYYNIPLTEPTVGCE